MSVTAKKGVPPAVQKKMRQLYWDGYRQGEVDTLHNILTTINEERVTDLYLIKELLETLLSQLAAGEEKETVRSVQ